MGFSYNFGRGIGALFPVLVGYASTRMRLVVAIGVHATAAYLLVTATVWLLPETRGHDLHDNALLRTAE